MVPDKSNLTEKHSGVVDFPTGGRTMKGSTYLVNTIILFILFIIPFQAVVSAQGRNHSHPTPNVQTRSDQVIESGRFRIYELKQVQGEETYEIRRNNAGPTTSSLTVTAEINLPFMGEDQKPNLSASLRTKDDLTPESFQLKGVRPSEIAVDTSITIDKKTALFNDNKAHGPTLRTRQLQVPENFFVFGGYVPVTMEMMLVRYWLTHGRKNPLTLLPEGEAFIEHRGSDTVMIQAKPVVVDRYHLSGSKWGGGWGRQTLWLDSEKRLVAAVNLGSDKETNLYAIRDGYESNLSFFLKRAVEDGIDRLTEIADRLSPRNTAPLVLLGGTLIDGTGASPINNSAVVIEGDRIIAAGPRSEITIPTEARVVDVSGQYILPGLWDMHSHLYQVEFGPTYLAAGITTARDVGNDIEFGTSLRDAAKQRRGLGPRLLLAGYIDGKNDFHSFDVQAGTPAEARAAVQHYKNAGFEQIKIRDHVKPDILKVITEEAHRLGMTVVGHVPEGMNALQAVEAGMDQLSHLNFAMTAFFPKEPRNDVQLSIDLNSPDSKNALRVFKEHSTVVDATLAVLELMIRPKNMPIESFEPGRMKVAPELIEQIDKKGAPAEQAEDLRLAMNTLLKTIVGLHRAGVPIVAGTDVGVPGYTLHRELELYVKAGLTPMEAIQAATLIPARVMKIEKEVGTIEPGKRADLLIVAGNPLENISNIRKTKFVVTQGRLFDCDELKKIVGFKP
jgi:imidazolonepropionase-like amidohydrolase